MTNSQSVEQDGIVAGEDFDAHQNRATKSQV